MCSSRNSFRMVRKTRNWIRNIATPPSPRCGMVNQAKEQVFVTTNCKEIRTAKSVFNPFGKTGSYFLPQPLSKANEQIGFTLLVGHWIVVMWCGSDCWWNMPAQSWTWLPADWHCWGQPFLQIWCFNHSTFHHCPSHIGLDTSNPNLFQKMRSRHCQSADGRA